VGKNVRGRVEATMLGDTKQLIREARSTASGSWEEGTYDKRPPHRSTFGLTGAGPKSTTRKDQLPAGKWKMAPLHYKARGKNCIENPGRPKTTRTRRLKEGEKTWKKIQTPILWRGSRILIKEGQRASVR